MDRASSSLPSRCCATCDYWTRGWLGPDEWGFCTWRESTGRSHQPRMNVGSHYTVCADGHVLETRCDSCCLQWRTQKQPARKQ